MNKKLHHKTTKSYEDTNYGECYNCGGLTDFDYNHCMWCSENPETGMKVTSTKIIPNEIGHKHSYYSQAVLDSAKQWTAEFNKIDHTTGMIKVNDIQKSLIAKHGIVVKVKRTVVEEEYKLVLPLSLDLLVGKLQSGICTVHFKKLDGTLREMKCTLNSSELSKTFGSYTTPNNRNKTDTITVLDKEMSDWRSFQYFRVYSLVDANGQIYLNLDYKE